MTKLYFNSVVTELHQLAKEALQTQEFRMPYTNETTTDKGFWLVKDQGIYLMNAHKRKPKQSNIVVYAMNKKQSRTYDPEGNTNWFEDCSIAVGYDDFAEWIPMDLKQLMRLSQGRGDRLIIDIDETSLTVSLID